MKVVTLAHGSGGKQTSELIDTVFKKHLSNEFFTSDDASVLPQIKGKLAMSTDGFIVSPAFFNGGNIGKLSICGTVNDLTCMGAKPLYMTCGFVIEEGYPFDKLEEIVSSMASTAKEVGVKIVAGDTKVAGIGQVDGVFITTTGIGEIIEGVETSGSKAVPGDDIIVTGDIGRHGTTILLERDDYGIEANVSSDCAPLYQGIDTLLSKIKDIHTIRDATRGGVGTVLYEIAEQSQVGIDIETKNIPVLDEVKGVTGMLGLDPLYLACEGRLVLIVPHEYSEDVVSILKTQPYMEKTAIIGKVIDTHINQVIMTTEIGSKTILPPPSHELLPRIC